MEKAVHPLLRVALFARAWIETDGFRRPSFLQMSPSSRGRGLKPHREDAEIRGVDVALFARAWIETRAAVVPSISHPVALFARAWIETCSIAVCIGRDFESPSSRGRGLKRLTCRALSAIPEVALFARAWIETCLRRRQAFHPSVALFARAWIETAHSSNH